MSEELQPEILNGPLALDGLKLRLAAQVAPRRWRRSLESLAQAIDSGETLEGAFKLKRAAQPRELRCLITESLSVPNPTTLILEAVRIRQSIGRDWRELMQLMIYPLILFGLALLVGGSLSFLMLGSREFSIFFMYEQMYDDFGLRGGENFIAVMHDQQQAIIGLTFACGWTVAVMLTVFLIGPRWAWSAVLGGVLLFGRPLRWISLREILQRYELFISQGLSTIAATERVTHTFQFSSQSVASKAIAGRIQAGIPLGQALCGSLLSDGLSRPALRLLDLQGSDMPHALAETAELLGKLIEQRCRGLAMLLPVFSILFVGTIVWATLSAYLLAYMPMVSMITSLA